MRQLMTNLYQQNRSYVLGAGIASMMLLTVFKLVYPYPNMVLDSYYYILAAISHTDVNAWAIGYSWFLGGVGVFSHSPMLLVIFQYLFLEGSLLAFFLTIQQFLPLSSISKRILFVFFFCNPLLLYCANFVMADALFISLSVLWISLLLWMVFRPRPYLLVVHAVLILLVFTVRYNALYYPVVATVALIMSKYRLSQKLVGIGLQFLLIGAFIGYTSIRVGEMSGQPQFSPFGNWKTANDALYMYGHIYQHDHDSVPEKFAVLHNSVRQYFGSGAKVDDLLDYKSQFYGSLYMFFNTSPLVRYKNLLYGQDTQFVNFVKMAHVGPLYGAYGAWLIRNHPMAFAEYFVRPNLVRYIFPPMEAFGSLPPFFLRPDYLGDAARKWFGVKTLTPGWPAIRIRGFVLAPYQTLAAFIHILFLMNLLGFMFMRGFSTITKPERYTVILLTVLWFCDLGFSLTAAATVMRYEIFPLIIELSLAVGLAERIYFRQTQVEDKYELSFR